MVQGIGDHHLICLQHLAQVPSRDEGADRVTQQIATLMESWIRIDPTQVHAWSALAQTIHHMPTPAHATVTNEAAA